jgi:hypothetical protein
LIHTATLTSEIAHISTGEISIGVDLPLMLNYETTTIVAEKMENGELSIDKRSNLTPLLKNSDESDLKILRYLLLLSGLKSTTTAMTCGIFLSIGSVILICGYIYHSFEIRRLDWAILCHVTFSLHGAAIYALLALKFSQQLDFFSVMKEISQPLRYSFTQKLERNFSIASTFMLAPPPSSSSSSSSSPLIGPWSSLNLQFTSQLFSIYVFTLAMINFIMIAVNVGNPVAVVLCLAHTLTLHLISLLLWFFYSLAWFLPMALVCPPMIYMLQKIFHFERFVEAHLSEDCDLDLLMHWYSELYDANGLLQKAFGSLVTLVIVIGGVMQIVLVMVPPSSSSSSISPFPLTLSSPGPLHYRYG